jgi:Beta-propeller domains of methanol dehydrogenase type
MHMIHKMSVAIIVIFLILASLVVPVMAAGGNGGNGGSSGSGGSGGSSDSSGSGNSGGNGGSSGSDNSGGASDSSGNAGTGSAQPGQEGPQSQQLLEEQARKQQEAVEQPGVQINQQDRDQDQSRTNISSAEEQATADLIRQQDRDYFFDQIKEQQQNLSRDRDQDQAQVDLALYALSISANVSGSTEPQLTRLAAEVNSSFTAALQAQQQIQNRDSFSRVLFGGDQQAAGLLLQYSDQNQQRIQEMEQLLMNCSDCDPQVRLMLEEQVKVLSQEQNRLTVIGQQEQGEKGLFGWLFG